MFWINNPTTWGLVTRVLVPGRDEPNVLEVLVFAFHLTLVQGCGSGRMFVILTVNQSHTRTLPSFKTSLTYLPFVMINKVTTSGLWQFLQLKHRTKLGSLSESDVITGHVPGSWWEYFLLPKTTSERIRRQDDLAPPNYCPNLKDKSSFFSLCA